MFRPHAQLLTVLCALLLFVYFAPVTSTSQATYHSLSLNGTSSHVSVPNSTSLSLSGPITIEAWIKVNAINGNYQDIVCKESYGQAGTGGGYEFAITNTGKVRLDLYQSHNQYTTAIGSTTVSTGAWHHVAGVFDGSQIRIYLNGVLDGSLSTTNGPASGTSALHIGKSAYTTYYFGGLIDEVRISAAALYSSNFTPGLGPGSNVRGLWKFNGQSTNDSSSNGNHGTLQSGATYSADVPSTTNNVPTVAITHPQNNTAFVAGSTMMIDVAAADSDGIVTKVDFYQGTTLLGSDTSSPYTFAWANVPGGVYSITAKATDDNSATATSSAITVSVVDSAGFHSLSLNGTSSYVSVPNSASISISGPITIEAWIKVNAINGNYQDIVCKESYGQAGTGGGYEFAITNTGKVRLDLYQSHNQYTTAIGSTTVSTGVWHHVAGVFDGSQIRVYLNGVLDGSLSTGNGPASGTSALHIGRSTYTTYYFGGLIDEVRISAAALYSSNFTPGLGPGSNVRGLWNFNGQSTNDSSGNSNHGTLQGGATYSTNVPSQSGPQRPVSVAGGPYNGQLSQALQFSSTGSFDPDGTIVSCHWNFGDGTSANSANPTHSYSTPGLYTATLTVTDNAGLLASATASVNIQGPSNARLDPRNQTGGGAENPLSRNFNWSLPLVSLPGRAGLDLGLTLSYNSLVWTKNGSFISFDDDNGFPSAGFRLGFPVIHPLYYNQEVSKYAYLLIGSDGGRTELRQVGTSALFEASDSSHLLLDTSLTLPAPDNGKFILWTTDGTKMWYEWLGSEFQCTQIKDRNGNFITINYLNGRISTIIDTVNREIKFEYVEGRLDKITQVWKQGTNDQRTHTWASFAYNEVTFNTIFTDLTISGPANGSSRKMLSKITLADNSETPANNSRFEFSYTSWGQIWKVSNFAADNRLVNYRSYNLPGWNNPPGPEPQTDCPRFTERRDWAENWNRSGNPANGYMLPTGVEQEVVTGFTAPQPGTANIPNQSPQSATVVQITKPDQTFEKIYFLGTTGTDSGWRVGLPFLVESYNAGGSIPQRQVVTTWTQDDDTSLFVINPRVSETNVYDPSGNRKRSDIVYQPVVLGSGMTCQLPQDIREYDTNATTVLRTMRTIYEDNSAYLSRRILGLPKHRSLYEGLAPSGTLWSKLEFIYDTGSIEGTELPVQHDNAGYSASFVVGRGNLTVVRRYDVTNTAQFATTTNKYNRAGLLVSSKDPLNHGVTVSYTDSFASNGDPTDADPQDPSRQFTTVAYPTTVNDADGKSTEIRYNYDFGAPTWRQTPQPNVTTNTPGPIQTFTYDNIGRMERTTNLVNNAFTRYVYGPNYLESFSSINTLTETANEGHTLQVFDGVGRVLVTATEHPVTGAVDRFAATLVLYDQMGRVRKGSNPTETDITIAGTPVNPSQFVPQGDDTIANGVGWKYVEQTYDWKGRPLVTTNQDGTTKTMEYTGCGCAGGEVTTLTDEGTLVAGVAKRRQQKLYADVLGRTVKSEVWDFEGTGSGGVGRRLDSTSVTTYNARDQVTVVRNFAGAPPNPDDLTCPTGTCQKTEFTYDGHGRMATKHVPEQDAETKVTWVYNLDDTIQTITDARGAVAAFGYNNRHLISTVSYTAPAPIPVPSPTTYNYDAAGNRTSMTDDQGVTNYHYDQLSQMDWEERNFSGVSGVHRLTYGYNLAGQLQSMTDPVGFVFSYVHDTVGRVTKVANALTGETTTYAKDLKYRASGVLKELTHGGNNFKTTLTYNHRLQLQQYRVVKSPQQGSTVVIHSDYGYYDDGRLKSATDGIDNKFDRSYRYDQVGSLSQAFTGSLAISQFADSGTGPYYQTYQHDVWGNLTARNGRYWSEGESFSASYTNNRRQGSTWFYDAEGNVIQDADAVYTYDAVGHNRAMTSANGQRTTTQWHDGNGEAVRVERRKTVPSLSITNSYYLRSSVLGGRVVTELNSAGQKTIGRVYLGDIVLGRQDGTNPGIEVRHENPITGNDAISFAHGTFFNKTQEDPMGINAGLKDPFEEQVEFEPDLMLAKVIVNRSGECICPRCFADGIELDCRIAGMMVEGGSAARCPNDDCGPRVVYNPHTNRNEFSPLTPDHETGQLGSWRWRRLRNRPTGRDTGDTVFFGTWFYRREFATGAPFQLNGLGALGLTVAGLNPQHPPQKPMVTTQTEKLLTEDCLKFLNSILAQLKDPHSKNLLDILEAAKGRLFTRTLSEEEKKKRHGGTHSRAGDPSFYIYLGEAEYANDPYLLIHELFHGAAGTGTGYTHLDMATAAYKVALADATFMKYANRHGGLKEPKLPDYSPSSKDPEDWYNADVFDSIARHGCTHPIDWP